MDPSETLAALGLTGAAYAAPVSGGNGVGFGEHVPVAPASVMKIQVALAVETGIAEGRLDGDRRIVLHASRRTPGPTGISLMRDDVTMSVRDLVIAMLTISDNAATDELIELVGLPEINRLTAELGLTHTAVASNLRDSLDAVARDAGFADYRELVAHQPEVSGPPTEPEIRERIANSKILDPHDGTRTTVFETVALLQAIWTHRALPPEACRQVRRAMTRQLSRARIASGFDSSVTVAAKSGALLGVVRNEAGVVTYSDGGSYAVAVFTRKRPEVDIDPAEVDRAIGQTARILVGELRGGQDRRNLG